MTHSIQSLLASEKFQHSEHDLPIIIGTTASNEVIIEDLAKMPHLLVTGGTGQGKSVALKTILLSLLYKKKPTQLKFVLADSKLSELSSFKSLNRHFLTNRNNPEETIIAGTQEMIDALNALCVEMDWRFNLLFESKTRNIKEYNSKQGNNSLPYIVLVIDEYADYILTAGKDFESPLGKLAQKARVVGIHLTIATQRASTMVQTQIIKANFPARLHFWFRGDEQTCGEGQFSMWDEIIQVRCPFVSASEVESVVNHVASQDALYVER